MCCDTHCVVPQRDPASARSCERAFSFRDATDALRKASLRNSSVAAQLTVLDDDIGCQVAAAVPPPALHGAPQELPFVDAEAWLADLGPEVAGGLIQTMHQVDPHPAPVEHIAGGSEWGYRRWAAYRQSPSGLASYASKRNDFLSPNAVSRLSAHHHFGMVSPFTVACEAASVGATKFVDEFLVWRELSYAFCAKRMVPHDRVLEMLPKWAAKTLTEHAGNPRPRALARQQLEHAKTGDVFWDAMCNDFDIVSGRVSRIFLRSMSPDTCCAMYFAWCAGLSDADWGVWSAAVSKCGLQADLPGPARRAAQQHPDDLGQGLPPVGAVATRCAGVGARDQPPVRPGRRGSVLV